MARRSAPISRRRCVAGAWRHYRVRDPAQHQDQFIQPLAGIPIAKFLERNADGGIHHICYDVPDIIAARDTLVKEGARVLGDGEPRIGAHGKPVLFLHPKDFSGALVEIEQA
jgi:methylmalonyl-CoA/ethylmalonyl-CoA epimerase